jgi:hypothetical protein
MIFWVVNKIIAAYIISTVAFLLLILFFKSLRRRTNIFLNKANLVIVFVLLLNIVLTGEETIKCLVSEKSNSNSFPADTWTNQNRQCTTIFVGTFLFAFLFHSLFFFNRHRTNVTLTIVSILLLTFMYNYERLTIYVTSLYRDYLPSSWSSYYDWTGTVWTIVFSILYFAFCWTNRLTLKNKKLINR